MIDFVSKKKVFFSISIALMAICILSSLLFGVNLDIQFRGGSLLTYSYTGDINLGDFQGTVESALQKRVSLQQSQDLQSGTHNIVISLTSNQALTSEEQGALSNSLKEGYPDNSVEMVSVSNVDAAIGREFFAKSLVAVALASALMVLYIAYRFKKISGWSAGVMAVIALLHDVIIVYGTFVICRFSIDTNFMAAVLTILGYSVNDTIIIYDRIRENRRIYGPKLSTAELVNKSINQSMRRTIHTTATTVTALLVVCIVSLVCNVTTIITFAFPIMIGMLSGVFSSVCLVPSLWVAWQEHSAAKKAQKANR